MTGVGLDRAGITDRNFCDLVPSCERPRSSHPRIELRGLSIHLRPIGHLARQQHTEQSPIQRGQIHPRPPYSTHTLCPRQVLVHELLPPIFFSSFKESRSDAPGDVSRLPGPPAKRETSQYFRVLSKLPLTNPRPSGVNATPYTLSLCPRSLSNNSPVRASQIRTTY